MNVGSLCSGIGGFDLAARWLGWRTAWFAELAAYPSAVLAQYWPGVPNHGDLRTIDYTTVEPVDLVCAGFPCQPVSQAGKRLAQADERWLWPEIARAVRDLRPRYVVLENVPGLLTRAMGDVLGDLAALGYDAEWTVLSAADVGAPHLRERIWIVAYPNTRGFEVVGLAQLTRLQGPSWSQPNGQGQDGQQLNAALDDTNRVRCGGDDRGHDDSGWRSHPSERRTKMADTNGPNDSGERLRKSEPPGTPPGSDHAYGWDVEPNVGRVAHGVPARVDRLAGLGNAIVPACALRIFEAIEATKRGAGVTMSVTTMATGT